MHSERFPEALHQKFRTFRPFNEIQIEWLSICCIRAIVLHRVYHMTIINAARIRFCPEHSLTTGSKSLLSRCNFISSIRLARTNSTNPGRIWSQLETYECSALAAFTIAKWFFLVLDPRICIETTRVSVDQSASCNSSSVIHKLWSSLSSDHHFGHNGHRPLDSLLSESESRILKFWSSKMRNRQMENEIESEIQEDKSTLEWWDLSTISM